jgi:hypothetical protein
MSQRVQLALLLAVSIVWQLYNAYVAARYGPFLAKLLTGLGFEAPMITRSLIQSRRWWIAIPVVSTLFAADVLRRERPSPFYAAGVVVIALTAAFIMQAWIHEALLVPFQIVSPHIK